ncbi:MAG: ComF family protein [Bacteroidales bacterium]
MFKYLINLFFPKICCGCNIPLLEHENLLCDYCLNNLPITVFSIDDNPIFDVLCCYDKVNKASYFLDFRKHSIVQSIIHKLKYKNSKQIGEFLGEMAVKKTPNVFSGVDIIIPVPLHKKKLNKRGYNQSVCIAQGISKQIKKPIISNSLIKIKFTETQTHKNKYERGKNIKDSFKVVNTKDIIGLNVLVVDDVFTTGATVSECIKVLSKYVNSITIFTLAYAVK